MSELSPTLTTRQRFWLEHLRACGSRSLKAYAEANGLSAGALYAARAQLKRRGLLEAVNVPRFTRVVRKDEPGAPTLCRIRLMNGVMVEMACESGDWPKLLTALAALA